MKAIVLFVALSASAIAGEPLTALIPFADESYVTQREIDAVERGLGLPERPEIQERIGDSLTVTLGQEPMPKHLVRVHGCPQWVADLYARDAKNLARIHLGYELKSLQDEYSDSEFKKLFTDTYSRDYERMRRHYASRRAHYGKFKMLRVKEKTADGKQPVSR